MSSDSQPTRQQLHDVQIWLTHLDERCEAEPHRVLEETGVAAPVLAAWASTDAYAWLMALRAKAFRLVDDLENVHGTVDAVLPQLRDDQVVVAHLELEKGMALTQFDRPKEAAVCLRHAVDVFARHGDQCGEAWALVALADAYSGSGYPEDPYPLLRRALNLAEATDDERATRRAWKQLAVTYRHRGELAHALEAIEQALDGDLSSHTRANYLLERGHLLTWSGRFGEADADYEEAAIAYLECRDELGRGNVERALAHNALMLGRFDDGLKRLGVAAEHYQRAENLTGLGYVLREQSSTRLAQGDTVGAIQDAEQGLEVFRASADVLGLAGMLTTTARMQHRLGNGGRAEQLLVESLSLTANGANPLARANALSLQAEIDPDAGQRIGAAKEAARLFSRLEVWVGEAMAHAAHVKALSEFATGDPMPTFAAAVHALRRARIGVVDPGRRADHDFALRDVTTTLLRAGTAVGGISADVACANLVLDSAPLGLRSDLTAGAPGPAVADFISRVASLPVRRLADAASQRPLLQQLSATMAAIDPPSEVPWFSFADVQAVHPDHAVLVVGSPQHDGTLPLAWALPNAANPSFALVSLDERAVDSLDSLGYAVGTGRSVPLWEDSARSWQTELTEVLLPAELQCWALREGGRLAVLLPPLLAHMPIEALLVEAIPLGVRVAVSRIPAPNGHVPRQPHARRHLNGYLDPALPWAPERAMLCMHEADCITDAAQVPALLGTNTVTHIGCHGVAETRIDGALVSTAGERVLDAVDLLHQPLTDSVVIFESCYSGRYMGERTGEQLTLATTALVAGATAAVAGLFSLPADDETTGVISAALIDGLSRGVDASEALRRARLAYWEGRPESVRRPGGESASMPSDAPWAWAGLVAFTR